MKAFVGFHAKGQGFDHCLLLSSSEKAFCPHWSLSTQVYLNEYPPGNAGVMITAGPSGRGVIDDKRLPYTKIKTSPPPPEQNSKIKNLYKNKNSNY